MFLGLTEALGSSSSTEWGAVFLRYLVWLGLTNQKALEKKNLENGYNRPH